MGKGGSQKRKIAVVGAGASGMMASIIAARNGCEVTLYEGMDRVGKKILSTGNGKCNFTNSDMSLSNFYGASESFLESVFDRFGHEQAVSFFKDLGMLVKQKNGYFYPASEQAATVLDLLRQELTYLGVQVVTETKITQVSVNGKGLFVVETPKGKAYFDRLILACGSKAASKTGSDGTGYELAKSFGHSLNPVVPGLVQMVCKESFFKSVAGVRTEGRVKVFHKGEMIAKEQGEIQFTDYGISGIPVFQVSREMNLLLRKEKELMAELDLLPAMREKELEEYILGKLHSDEQRTLEDFFTGILNKKLMLLFIKLGGAKPTDSVAQISKKRLLEIAGYCKKMQVTVTDNKGFDNAQVCAGGVKMSEITEHMESVYTKGLYFAGELLDVDGKCGGYNLQWAWSSGYLAGLAASAK